MEGGREGGRGCGALYRGTVPGTSLHTRAGRDRVWIMREMVSSEDLAVKSASVSNCSW